MRPSLTLQQGDLSLRVTGGELLLLSGAAGCGGWLKRMAGIQSPPPGIDIHLQPLPLSKATVRLLADRWPPVWLGHSVAEELRFGLRQHLDDDALLAALRRWGAQSVLQHTVQQLAREEALRVTLAGMLLAEPHMVLLERPTVALSAEVEAQLIAQIAAWAEQMQLIVVVATNRWQDWRAVASQRWHIDAQDQLPVPSTL